MHDLQEVERRLTELRSEQLKTRDRQRKAMIRGEIQYYNEARRRPAEGKLRPGAGGSMSVAL